jgi:hypothetical protein
MKHIKTKKTYEKNKQTKNNISKTKQFVVLITTKREIII